MDTMTTLTGRNERSLSGYADSLLDYPRWLLERDVDFTHCEFQGSYTETTAYCVSCEFGVACQWLTRVRSPHSAENVLPELLQALITAADYVQKTHCQPHNRACGCPNCVWLREVRGFLRFNR
jgi:hypothetical protein